MQKKEERKPLWSGRPSVGSYIALYAILYAALSILLITVEFYVASTPFGSGLLPSSISFASLTLPYPLQLLTAFIFLLAFLVKATGLLLMKARTKYSLFDDGLYIDLGLVNLENIFVAPMAFSDARLYMSLGMRMMKKGSIIVDTNDGRHFELKMVANPVQVQGLIRQTLSHPTFRTQDRER